GQGGYQIERVLPAAELATDRSRWGSEDVERLTRMLEDPDSAVRAWAAIGLRTRGEEAVRSAAAALRAALDDPSPPVRIQAAEALGRFGEDTDLAPAVGLLLASASITENDFFDALLALNALDYLPPDVLGGADTQGWRDRVSGLPSELEGLDRRFRNYVPRLLEAIWLDLDRAP
ncbi:MAG: HEAT repeat domain-containing protein, partial [Acidobacteria bacterium]|nr:HEAT repeat domain-containing protein [Acidobacteriota bacterium]